MTQRYLTYKNVQLPKGAALCAATRCVLLWARICRRNKRPCLLPSTRSTAPSPWRSCAPSSTRWTQMATARCGAFLLTKNCTKCTFTTYFEVLRSILLPVVYDSKYAGSIAWRSCAPSLTRWTRAGMARCDSFLRIELQTTCSAWSPASLVGAPLQVHARVKYFKVLL